MEMDDWAREENWTGNKEEKSRKSRAIGKG